MNAHVASGTELRQHTQKAEAPATLAVLAVIVLYGVRPEASVSLRSLLQSAVRLDQSLRVSVLVIDNSPGSETPPALPPGVRFLGGRPSRSLAQAYNDALEIGLAERFDWLLTLDQDTELPAGFLPRMLELGGQLRPRTEIAAIVPDVKMGGRLLSPHRQVRGLMRPLSTGWSGVPNGPVYAFNSGALLRTAALRQAGGYNVRFWLDGSDTDLFQRLADLGKRVYVAGALTVEHGFAMLDTERQISPERYRNVLLAESAVWDLHLGPVAALDRTVRLIARWFTHLVRRRDELRRIAGAALASRVIQSRRSRVAQWRRETAKWLPAKDADSGPLKRALTISVAMAAYNGERYIGEQIASILPQLGPEDEVVVVDDASHDGTVSLVAGIGDPRIRLIQHAVNVGVVASFEDALRHSTGDILFLSDMDDVWAPDKVCKMIAAFQRHPAAKIVTTSLSLIDEEGRPTDASEFLRKRRKNPGFLANVLRNNFQGSTMAIRASVLRQVLPFPARRLYLHDVWIATRNAMTRGEVVFLDDALLHYRRHSSNVSRPLSRVRQIWSRVQLMWDHLCRRLLDLL